MKIDIKYNEQKNWIEYIEVKHPECEHPEEYREQALYGDIELPGVYYCTICGKAGRLEPPDEDGEIFMDWSSL